MLDIYSYSKVTEFLEDAWKEKRKLNSQFTIRAWAQNMGIKHHAFLYDMINGKRKVPKSSIPKFVQSLNLDTNESLYFECLVDLSRARSQEERNFYMERMKAFLPQKNMTFSELESFRLLRDPLHYFISEMVLLKDFNPDPAWIKKRLAFKTSEMDITDAIERLITLDILREDPEGRLIRVDRFIASKSDVTDLALQDFHKDLSDKAKLAIENQNVLEREFRSMTLNFDLKDMPEAKEFIREFVKEFLLRFDKTTSPEREVYHMNLQFFAVTKRSHK